MKKYLTSKRGFVGLVGLLVAAAIVCFLAYKVMTKYLKGSSGSSATTGIPSAAPSKATLDDAKDRIKGVEEQMLDREQQLFK